jgi:3-deoxy-D-manno-octulosonate 8-phosphate phosphatase (KDO 8-P phosphatase)
MNPNDLSAQKLFEKAKKIKLFLTDCDGCLTDGGVYYGENGEVMKRFSIRDGMGVERLRNMGVETGIITGELSPSVKKRAEKLKINELHLGIKDKPQVLKEILERKNLQPDEIAYLGDDTNDIEIMALVGLPTCPADATIFAQRAAQYICQTPGGQGAFREVAELIIESRNSE